MSNQFDRHPFDNGLTHNAHLKVGGLETPCNEPIAVTKEDLDLLIVAVTLAEAHATKRRPAYRELRVRLQSREPDLKAALKKERIDVLRYAAGKMFDGAFKTSPVELAESLMEEADKLEETQ